MKKDETTPKYLVNNTRLVQRLATVPSDLSKKSHRVYGGSRLGLSSEQWDLIETAFIPEYMGAAEFEDMRLPAVLASFYDARAQLNGFAFLLKRGFIRPSWKRQIEADRAYIAIRDDAKNKGLFPPRRSMLWARFDRAIYVICPREWNSEVVDRIRSITRGKLLKMPALAGDVLDIDAREPEHRVQGWLELNNGFFFFANASMWERTGELFGLMRLPGEMQLVPRTLEIDDGQPK